MPVTLTNITMYTKLIAGAVLSLLLGGGVGYLLGLASAEEPRLSAGHTMPDGSTMADTAMNSQMEAMTSALAGKTGDAFDQAFLSEMIMHHQGAVQMAQAALANAKHAEIKEMAEGIIRAQEAEIRQMQEWRETWYASTESAPRI